MNTRKRIFLFAFSLLLLSSTATLNAQVTIGAEKAPEDFSILELISTTGGLRLPQLNSAQRIALTQKLNALTTEAEKQAAKGLVIYNTDTECTDTWNGEKWMSVCVTVAKTRCGAYLDGGVWLEFMCHNLGADTSLDPFTPAAGIHGGKYMWGISNGQNGGGIGIDQATDQVSTEDANVINDWLSLGTPPTTDAAWDMTTQNPCPAGWRLPTDAEWKQIVNTANNPQIKRVPETTATWTKSATNYATGLMIGEALFLPAAGNRATYGALSNRGSNGYYWSSTQYSTNGYTLYFNSTGQGANNNDGRYGFSIRCVAE